MRTSAICPTCATYENAVCVLYNGEYLSNTDINPLDNMQVALEKIDGAIGDLGDLINNLPTNGVQAIVAGTNVTVDDSDPAYPIVSATGAAGPQGLTGPAGPQGVAGPQGNPGPVGPAGLNWQGAWSASGTYVVDDAVGYDGASWFCIANVGPSVTTPDLDPTKWALLAAEGATGPAGPQGPTGATGPSGSSNGWLLTGNAGTTPSTNFMGTTDAQDVIFKCNNTEYLRFKNVTGGNDEVTFSKNVKVNSSSIAQVWVNGPSSYIILSSGVSNNPVIVLSKSSTTVNIGSTNITGTKTLQLPNATGTLVASVNGATADAAGNVTISSSGWGLTGNGGTVDSVNFIGTTDGQSLVMKANNVEYLRLNPNTGAIEASKDINLYAGGTPYISVTSASGFGAAAIGTDSFSKGLLRLTNGANDAYLGSFNITTQRGLQLPDTDGNLAVSVNGINAGTDGNIIVPRPYLVYTAIFDNNSLTPVILENTLGVNLSITNPSGQIYEFTSPSPIFVSGKTWVMPSNFISASTSYNFFGVRWTDTKVRYTAINNFENGNTGFTTQIVIEIRVYP